MLFSFSKRLLVLSVLAGVLYYLMTYPMVFEKVRKYLPFKFNNTKIMLIFNSVVFSLVMYFVGFILLKSLHLEGIEQTPTPTPSYPRITGVWKGTGTDGKDVTINISRGTSTYNEYNMVVTNGNAGWKTGKLQCNETYNPLGCGNLQNYKVDAQHLSNDDTEYWKGGSGTVSNSIIKWDNGTVWTKRDQNSGEMWLPEPEVLSKKWVFTERGCELTPVNDSNTGFSTKESCDKWLNMATEGFTI